MVQEGRDGGKERSLAENILVPDIWNNGKARLV
jgi:hypothetical protein